MPPIPERTIYSTEEAALHTAQSATYLLNEGALGKLQFFVFVPDNIQVMNVDMFDRRDQESSNSVMRTLNHHLYDQKPLLTEGIKLLMLSRSDCKRILAMGTFDQDEFYSAGKLDERLMVQEVELKKPPENKFAVNLPFPRRFATYIKQPSSGRWGQETSPERKSISLTANILRVSADALRGYIKVQPSVAPAVSIPAQIPNMTIALSSKEKRTRSLSDLSRLIKKVYLSLNTKEREEKLLIWAELVSMAKSKPASPPLIDEVLEGIRYEKSFGVEKTLTYPQFLGRLKTIKDNLK